MQSNNEIQVLNSLPNDTYELISKNLRLNELVRLSTVSKDWNQIFNNTRQLIKIDLNNAFNKCIESELEPENDLVIEKLVNEAIEFGYLPLLWDTESSTLFNKKLANLIGTGWNNFFCSEVIVDRGNILKSYSLPRTTKNGEEFLHDVKRFKKGLQHADFSNTDNFNADLSNGNCDYSHFKNCNLCSSDLKKTTFKGADLEGVTISGSLRNTNFVDANLQYAKLLGVSINIKQLMTAKSLLGISICGNSVWHSQLHVEENLENLKQRILSDYTITMDFIFVAKKAPSEKIQQITEMLFRTLSDKHNFLKYKRTVFDKTPNFQDPDSPFGNTHSYEKVMNQGIEVILKLFEELLNTKNHNLPNQETMDRLNRIATSDFRTTKTTVNTFFTFSKEESPVQKLQALLSGLSCQAKLELV